MELYQIKNLSFSYPNNKHKALNNISLSVQSGEFITLCGKSGCGKTTLLRLLKSCLAPFGELRGEINFKHSPLQETDTRTQASEIGFVLQNPDQQIVTDKVWHELAFGLESLGLSTTEIRTRVSEMASFFGIQNWFYRKTNELSGGQKQLLNLASVMVMQPEILILDEPTSLLDPIAASEFLKTLQKINDELGTTILLTEHRLEEAFALSHRVIVMDDGEILADNTPKQVGRLLKEKNHDMYDALPIPMRVFGALEPNVDAPLTIREGKKRLEQYAKTHVIDAKQIPSDREPPTENPALEAKNVFFRYEKNLPDVVKDFNLCVSQGEFFAILGGNGTGKSTALSLLADFNTPQRGKIFIQGRKISEQKQLYHGLLGVLPQNPQSLFAKKSVRLELFEASNKTLSQKEREEEVLNMASLCEIESLLEQHPYDLSGGEQQRTALAILLLRNPQILILDEPTKGMDAHFKKHFALLLKKLTAKGLTVLMVSHDIEFCAEHADRCAMFFDGSITSCGTPRRFFVGNRFYTTSTNRMARKLFPNAVLAEDILAAAGKKSAPKPQKPKMLSSERNTTPKTEAKHPKRSKKKIAFGLLFLLCFVLSCIAQASFSTPYSGKQYIWQAISVLFAALCLLGFLPKRKANRISKPKASTDIPQKSKQQNKRTALAALFLLVSVSLTIYIGMAYWGDRKYYFISLLIILETLLPFAALFEKRKPQARETVAISVLCAIAVAGRAAFFMLPQFKPVAALVILSGVCFGGEIGFLVGAVSAFVSNFFFGQGPWTPWQMFAFGSIGLLSGILFQKGVLKQTKISLSIFGFLVTLILYGSLMNLNAVFMMTNKPTWEMIASSILLGFPADLIHASSTAFFLWFLTEPMTEKLERIKIKYGLLK